MPGNKAVLFTMWAGSHERARIGVLDVATGTIRVLVQGGTYPKFVRSGHIVYADGGALRAVAFDVDRVAVTSEPVTILDGVLTKPTGASNFAVAHDGTLAYVAGGFSGGDNPLVWVDREGNQEPLTGLSRQNYQTVRVSPKGTHLATDFGQPRDVWSYDMTRGTAVRVTTDPTDDQFPIWSPDGERLVFTSNRSGRPEIDSQSLDGSGTAEKVFERPESQAGLKAEGWSKDGRMLLLTDALGGSATSSLQLDGDRRYMLRQRVNSSMEGRPCLPMVIGLRSRAIGPARLPCISSDFPSAEPPESVAERRVRGSIGHLTGRNCIT